MPYFRNINLHPDDHLPSELKGKTWDVIVIGSGPVGRALAIRTAAAKLNTVVVEDELIGGDCPYWACIPSKALLRPGETLMSGRAMNGSKQLISEKDSTGASVDVKAVFARRDSIVQNWTDGWMVDLLASSDVVVVRGRGSLQKDKRVVVKNVNGDELTLQAKQAVVIATGSVPVIHDVPGLQDIDYWTSRQATAADVVPEHLVILGGGVVGSEMATFYSSLGKKVTLVTRSSRLLPRVEIKASEMVQQALQKDGVDILTSTTPEKVTKVNDTDIEVLLSNNKTITASHVLVGGGRRAATDGLGLEQLGISTTSRLAVSENMSVEMEDGDWLYAIGDVNGRNMMTHMGVYQARAAANTIIARAKNESIVQQPFSDFSATADHDITPQITFTDPNIASVGLTEAEARNRGLKVRAVETTFTFPGAFVHAEFNYDGWAKWVINEDNQLLLGATFVGREAGDYLHASTVAIVGKVPVPKLWHAVAAFPSMSEIYTALLGASGY